ncbi:unnamed protein product [Calicophoron daubneyi]|uniref:Solute carrier family 35 member F6 n=1 Tax=Calicophoron daubneyi TaxID=300641 RepID=A0AAV2TXY5_CALDB
MGFTAKQIVFVIGMLTTGTINTISKKMQLNCIAPGYYNHSANDTKTVHQFRKPWFQTLLMFLGEFLCLFAFFVLRYRKRRRIIADESYSRLAIESGETGLVFSPLFSWIFVLPATLDLLGTTIAGIGLIFVDASIWQMMRGSLIIFAGVLSIVFLKRRLACFHWAGMLFTVFGLTLVGTKSVFSEAVTGHSAAESALGVLLILIGAFTTSCQMIVEELFIKKRGFHPLQAVGIEGLFGILLMICIALPCVHFIPGSDLNGSYENVIDALYQTANSPLILGNTILYVLSIAFFNYFGLSITRYLSAVHRTLVDALRTTFVWLLSLLLFYSMGSQFGEPFDLGWGLIQIDGFACLVIGTLIYNKVMDLSFMPCCKEPTPPDVVVDNSTVNNAGNEEFVHDNLETPLLDSARHSYLTEGDSQQQEQTQRQ